MYPTNSFASRSLMIRLLTMVPYPVDFEYGRLLARAGDKDGARTQFDLVMSGKPLEVNAAGRKVCTDCFNSFPSYHVAELLADEYFTPRVNTA